MAGLRPPEEDIGVLQVPARLGLALFGLFGILLIALALLERVGVDSGNFPLAVTVASFGIVIVMAFLSPGRRPGDFYVAGRSIAPIIGGLAAASGLSGLLVVGLAAGGAGIVATACGLLLGLLISTFLIAPGLNRYGGYTAGHFLAARFGVTARLVGVAVAFSASFLLLAAQLKMAAPLAASIFGMTPAHGLYATTGLLVLILLPGGMRSLTWTQFTQYFVIALACLLPASFLSAQDAASRSAALATASGFAPLLQALAQPVRAGAAMQALLPVLLIAVGIASLPPMLARSLATSSGREAAFTTGCAFVFTLVLITACLVLGQVLFATAGIAGADVVAGDLVAQALLLTALPSFLAGLLMAGMLAALLATGLAALHAAASALSYDLWDEVLDPTGAAGRRIFVARILLLAVAAAAIHLAPRWPAEAPALAGWALALAAAGSFVPLLLGLWWRRCNAAAAISGMLVGFTTALLLFAIDFGLLRAVGIDPAAGTGPAAAACLGVSAAFIITVLISLTTETPPLDAQDIAAGRQRRGKPPMQERAA